VRTRRVRRTRSAGQCTHSMCTLSSTTGRSAPLGAQYPSPSAKIVYFLHLEALADSSVLFTTKVRKASRRFSVSF
jgi:hypothetical protein